MLTLQSIQISASSKRVDFDYSMSDDIKKFFSKNKFFIEYDIDINSVPEEIIVIPFLANILPVSWFAGFDVNVKKLDENFYNSILQIKKEFAKYYPEISNNRSNFYVSQLICTPKKNKTHKTAMLFSGGIDSYATFFRHYDETPDLIMIRGADIALKDIQQWEGVMNYMHSTAILKNNNKYYISSNIRDFMTFEVDKLLPNFGWWGKIQHGLALTTLCAPLVHLKNYRTIYIASTRSIHIPFSPWGSMPETDNLIKWGCSKIIHDGYELSRLMKVETIIEKSAPLENKPLIRVCYNEFKSDLNCNRCEKCCRTMFALLINSKNPNDYGFRATNEVYGHILRNIKKGLSTYGTKLYWKEMLHKISTDKLFIFTDKEIEISKIEEIRKTFEIVIRQNGSFPQNKWKLDIIHRFPKLFDLYLKFRRKIV